MRSIFHGAVKIDIEDRKPDVAAAAKFGLRIGTWKAIVDWSKAALGRGNEENVPLQKARREDWK